MQCHSISQQTAQNNTRSEYPTRPPLNPILEQQPRSLMDSRSTDPEQTTRSRYYKPSCTTRITRKNEILQKKKNGIWRIKETACTTTADPSYQTGRRARIWVLTPSTSTTRTNVTKEMDLREQRRNRSIYTHHRPEKTDSAARNR